MSLVNILRNIDLDKLDKAIEDNYVIGKGSPYLIMAEATKDAIAAECNASRLNIEGYSPVYRGCPIAIYSGLEFGSVEIR